MIYPLPSAVKNNSEPQKVTYRFVPEYSGVISVSRNINRSLAGVQALAFSGIGSVAAPVIGSRSSIMYAAPQLRSDPLTTISDIFGDIEGFDDEDSEPVDPFPFPKTTFKQKLKNIFLGLVVIILLPLLSLVVEDLVRKMRGK